MFVGIDCISVVGLVCITIWWKAISWRRFSCPGEDGYEAKGS